MKCDKKRIKLLSMWMLVLGLALIQVGCNKGTKEGGPDKFTPKEKSNNQAEDNQEEPGSDLEEEELQEENSQGENLQEGVPVYTLAQAKEIKKYLSPYPNTWEEVQQLEDVIFVGHDGKIKKKSLWKTFYSTEEDAAVVIVYPTTEGDYIYKYLSRVDGFYHYYSDYSRDNFGGGHYMALCGKLVSGKEGSTKTKSRYTLGEVLCSSEKKKKFSEEKIEKIKEEYRAGTAGWHDLALHVL